MGFYKNGEKNGYTYSNGSLKKEIDNNEFVKKIRKKLMEKRLKERAS
ncbi:MAG: hypothetical protein KGD68_07110 [Candidatus Lokiarchaeota archaeon]|nr:hypothetical protein [Candidatus Lokiarchaeota archaeon]